MFYCGSTGLPQFCTRRTNFSTFNVRFACLSVLRNILSVLFSGRPVVFKARGGRIFWAPAHAFAGLFFVWIREHGLDSAKHCGNFVCPPLLEVVGIWPGRSAVYLCLPFLVVSIPAVSFVQRRRRRSNLPLLVYLRTLIFWDARFEMYYWFGDF